MTNYERELLMANPKAWANLKGRQAMQYFESRNDWAQYVPIVLAAGYGIVKMLQKDQRRKHAQEDRDMRFYDRSAQHWWYFKRRVTPYEWGVIDARRKHGESYYQIFRSMGLVE